jgi:hypothetical protein
VVAVSLAISASAAPAFATVGESVARVSALTAAWPPHWRSVAPGADVPAAASVEVFAAPSLRSRVRVAAPGCISDPLSGSRCLKQWRVLWAGARWDELQSRYVERGCFPVLQQSGCRAPYQLSEELAACTKAPPLWLPLRRDPQLRWLPDPVLFKRWFSIAPRCGFDGGTRRLNPVAQ